MKSSTESSDPYRAYLDEEITGMGTLSGFCALALSAVLVAVQPFGEAWTKRVFLLPVGLLCTLLASLAFYLQRQKLAWHYGLLALDESSGGKKKDQLLRQADSWKTWIRYRV